MGRVAFHWRDAFERHGYDFMHLGPAEVGKLIHKSFFPWAAYRSFRSSGRVAKFFLVHEPAGAAFTHKKVPFFVFSHGLERRALFLDRVTRQRRLRSILNSPLWRLRTHSCDRGLLLANGALLINRADSAFAQHYYGLPASKILVFKNGVNLVPDEFPSSSGNYCRVLFLGSWVKRKGIEALSSTSKILYRRGIKLKWILAGTGAGSEQVSKDWPAELRDLTEIVPQFKASRECELFSKSDIFVLPSLFEGQPLALLQAMALNRCSITSDCCGQRDLILHRYNGLLHRPGDVIGLANLIEECAHSRAFRLQLGINAANSVKNRTWPAVSNEVVSFVESMLKTQSKKRHP